MNLNTQLLRLQPYESRYKIESATKFNSRLE